MRVIILDNFVISNQWAVHRLVFIMIHLWCVGVYPCQHISLQVHDDSLHCGGSLQGGRVGGGRLHQASAAACLGGDGWWWARASWSWWWWGGWLVMTVNNWKLLTMMVLVLCWWELFICSAACSESPWLRDMPRALSWEPTPTHRFQINLNHSFIVLFWSWFFFHAMPFSFRILEMNTCS